MLSLIACDGASHLSPLILSVRGRPERARVATDAMFALGGKTTSLFRTVEKYTAATGWQFVASMSDIRYGLAAVYDNGAPAFVARLRSLVCVCV